MQFKAFSNCFYFLRDKFSTRNLVSQVSLKLTYLRKNLQWVLRTTIILSWVAGYLLQALYIYFPRICLFVVYIYFPRIFYKEISNKLWWNLFRNKQTKKINKALKKFLSLVSTWKVKKNIRKIIIWLCEFCFFIHLK